MNVRAKVTSAEPATAKETAEDQTRAENVAPLKPVAAPVDDAAPKKKRRGKRFFLLFAVPVVLVIGGGYVWLTGGRYVSTDNAYVQRTTVSISSDDSGKISQVLVHENQDVKSGDVLFRIDPSSYKIALDSANAALAQARLQVQQLQAAYKTAVAKLAAAQSTADIQRRSLNRAQDLSKKGFATPANLDQAQLAVTQADNEVTLARQEVDSARAALNGNPDLPVDQQPQVMTALANKAQAELDLSRTTVRAPAGGVVSQIGKLNTGQYVSAGTAMLSIVQSGDTWVQANFKETELTHMVPGQKVDVGIDTYPGLDIKGTVGSIGAATGSEFSLIPAQNATGNWVKVVQRIPLRVHLDNASGKVLRSGMSASVSVDTGKTRLERTFK